MPASLHHREGPSEAPAWPVCCVSPRSAQPHVTLDEPAGLMALKSSRTRSLVAGLCVSLIPRRD